ncbi:MAG: hypothetical protein A2X94_00365 [Bdellovibrionales bacterium GWB1_55_8]|nr:MAG: hypothetical protein A2X94_00365 [Bdellovibrionales bacterium GWB1_55_8]
MKNRQMIPGPDFDEASPGWELTWPFPDTARPGSFVSGDPEGQRIRIKYYRRKEDGALVGKAWFGPDAEGPPGHAHGGSMSAVLDEAMGGSAWLAGYAVVAVRLIIDLRRMLPLGTAVFFEGSVEKVDGRKIHTRGKLTNAAGEVYAESQGLFIVLSQERFRGQSV